MLPCEFVYIGLAGYRYIYTHAQSTGIFILFSYTAGTSQHTKLTIWWSFDTKFVTKDDHVYIRTVIQFLTLI